MVKIKPVLLDIQQPFPQVRSKSGERARQYEIVLGNNLVHELNILKMKHFAQELGYRFWILVCSKGYVNNDSQGRSGALWVYRVTKSGKFKFKCAFGC